MSRAVIRDLGYQPYDGPRIVKSRTWVITWTGLRGSLKSRWTKWLGISALIATGGFGVAIYMAMKIQDFTGGMGMPIPPEINQKLFKADTFVGAAIMFCGGFLGFFAALLVAGPSLADDLKGGGLHFHFTRPVKTIDYIAGKILPSTILVFLLGLIPAAALGFMRLSLSPEWEAISRPLMTLAKGIALAGICGLSISVPAVALSAFTTRRGVARILWALLYWIPPGIGAALAKVLNDNQYYVISISGGLEAISTRFFGGDHPSGEHWLSGLLSLAVYIFTGLFLIFWTVRRRERTSG